MYRAWQTSRKNIKHSVEHFNTTNNSLYKLQKDFVYFVSRRRGVWAIVRSLRSHKSQCLSVRLNTSLSRGLNLHLSDSDQRCSF